MNKPDLVLLAASVWKDKAEKGEDLRNVGLIKTFIPDEIKVYEENGLPHVKFTVSTNARDRDADTLNQGGWQLDNYRKNPVVLYGHNSSGLPIGQALEIGVVGGKLQSVARFDTDIQDYSLPRTVVALLKRGTLRATSVGFIPMSWEASDMNDVPEHQKNRYPVDFQTQELVEYSVVPVPSNPEALIEAKKAGIDIAPIINWAGEILDMYGVCSVTKSGLWIPRPILEKCALIGAPTIVRAPNGGWDLVSKPQAAQVKEISKPVVEKNADEEDPIRWNRKLSKAFDIDRQSFTPSSAELALVSRFLSTPIKQIRDNQFFVPSAKIGSFLSALDEVLDADVVVEDVRNLNEDSKESPPVYEVIQLNSKKSEEFLIKGIRFLNHGDGKSVLRVAPTWYGLYVRTYAPTEKKALIKDVVDKTWKRSKELNFLKGEAFSLSGEFIERNPDMSFDGLFLTEKNEGVMRRLVASINDKGAAMDNRGVICLGPPGTGKTLSGRVLLNQANATFIWCSARDFHYSGAFGGMAYAFEVARECAPSILFIEDVDNYIDSRTTDLMKTEMDGIVQTKGITTLITTNYPERFPEALIDRPGRFHDVCSFDLPDEAVRRRMLKAWLPRSAEDTIGAGDAKYDMAIDNAVEGTKGYSGAHVRELTNYVRSIKTDENVDLLKAVEMAIQKIAENRDTIASARGYSPRKDFEDLVNKTFKAVQDASVEEKTSPTIITKQKKWLAMDKKSVEAALNKFDMVKQIERKPSTKQFTLRDGFTSNIKGEVKDGADSVDWVIVLRENGSEDGVVQLLGSVEREASVQYGMAIVEERQNSELEVAVAHSFGEDDDSETVYQEVVRLHWCGAERESGNSKTPNPAPERREPVANLADVVEAVHASLPSAIKKAIAEAMGRVEEA